MEAGDCLFCRLVAERSRVPHWVAESDRALAFLDIRPLRRGHTLVIPKRHATDLSDLSPDDLRAVAELAREVARRLRERLGTTGENLFVASGPGSEQTVFHFHLHVVPRLSDDGLGLRAWWDPKTREPTPADLTRLAESLRV